MGSKREDMTKSRAAHRARMYDLVEEYEKGQKSQRAFCAEHSLSVSTLNYWIGRYRTDQGREAKGEGRMIRLQIKDRPKSQIRIVTGSGIEISIPI